MTYKLYANGIDITELAGGLSWSSDTDTLGQSLSFSVPFDKDGTLLPKPFVNVGDKIALRYKTEDIFFGITVDEDRNGRSPIKFTCFDLAFYLNENIITIQFNDIPANQAIEELCKKVGIKCTVVGISVKIKKIYKAQAVSEILKDILKISEEQSGIKYRFEMRGDTLVIFQWKDIRVKANVEWISNPTRKRSLSGMKNRVEIVSGDEKTIKVLAQVEDAKNIADYGLLTHSQTIDEKEEGKAQTVAANLLKELNRIQEEGSVALIGNYEARAGRLITLNEPITGLEGDFLIKSANHTLNNGIHLMSLGLVVAT